MTLAISGIDVAYRGLQVLFDVSLDVTPGEMVCLLGGNAAGKSTTLKAVMGVVRPTRGAITLDGRPLLGESTERIVRMGLALVPENRRLFPELTVEQNLRLGAWHRTKADRARQLIETCEILPYVGTVLSRRAGTLSGGEQQQVAVARALMSDPRYLLMDEPSMGLAPALVERSFALLTALRSAGLGLLVVEQNTSRALAVADRAYVLRGGKIVLTGPAAELRESDAVREAFLGLPSGRSAGLRPA